MPADTTTEPNVKLRWYQFSLRSLMLAVTLFAILCSIVTVIMQKNTRFWRSPESRSRGTVNDRNRVEYQHIECAVWKNHYEDCYYAIAVGYVDFDPNLPESHCSWTYNYDMNEGGKLTVNGKMIEFSQDKRLLALSPFGQMEEIVLSPMEQKVVCSGDAERIWNQVVLKRVYRRQGKADAHGPVGHWTYSDINDKLAYEGSYKKGKRNGKWTYYHENSKVRAEISYIEGELDGQCRYFNDAGELKKTIKWKNDHPVDQTVQQIGLDYQEVRTPTTTSGGSR